MEWLINNKNRLTEIWENRVREQVQPAEGQTSLSLRNTLGIFLDELTAVLDQCGSPSTYASKGMSQVHGGQRASVSGYFLPQFLKEFSILREVITELLHEEGILTFETHAVIDKTIDSAISLASTEFVAVQQASIFSALQKAEMSNRDLEHFAAAAAHDLKSPLATISGYLSLLADESEEGLQESSAEYIELMQTTSQRMRDLIDRLLEFASLTKVEKPFVPVSIEAVVNAALQNLSEAIKKSKVCVKPVAQLPYVMGDADLLTQLFQNLIANSIKFRGSEPPEIRVGAEERDEEWLLSVEDNGIGFDPKNSEGIFALYKQLNSRAEYQGTGIGLASCRRVIELHGGRIWAESKVGEGSTFFFTIPKTGNQSPNHH